MRQTVEKDLVGYWEAHGWKVVDDRHPRWVVVERKDDYADYADYDYEEEEEQEAEYEKEYERQKRFYANWGR